MPSSSLTTSTLSFTQVFAFSRPDNDSSFGNIASPAISEAIDLTLPAGINQCYAATLTIAAGANVDVNFSSFANLIYEALSPTGICSIALVPTGTNAKVKLTPSSVDGLVWFFGTATDSITVNQGGFVVIADSVVATIDGTHKQLNFSNPGTGTLALVVLAYVQA